MVSTSGGVVVPGIDIKDTFRFCIRNNYTYINPHYAKQLEELTDVQSIRVAYIPIPEQTGNRPPLKKYG